MWRSLLLGVPANRYIRGVGDMICFHPLCPVAPRYLGIWYLGADVPIP